MPQGHGQLSGAHDYADSQLCRDDDDFLDREQGIPHIKGIPCRVVSLMSPSGDAEIVDASLLEPVE
jgi:hypothetical protein